MAFTDSDILGYFMTYKIINSFHSVVFSDDKAKVHIKFQTAKETAEK